MEAERAKVKAREEGHRLRREAPEQRDLSRRQGREKMSGRDLNFL